LPANRCEASEEGRVKLGLFCELVQKKMCRFWENPADLGSQVSRSLIKLIKSHPSIGWVRANLVPDESAAEEILSLKKKIEELEDALQTARISGPEGTNNLAQGEDIHEIHFSFVVSPDHWAHNGKNYSSSTKISWNTIFAAISPLMIHEASEKQLHDALSNIAYEYALPSIRNIKEFKGKNLMSFSISDEDFQTIKVQFRALGLITKSTKSRSIKDTNTYWTLTPYGDNIMTKLRAISRSAQDHRVDSEHIKDILKTDA
jgi:hypothetical protein